MVLLIEDNETIIKGLEYSFKQSNLDIKSLTNYNDSVSYLKDNTPKLIILDISLPDGDGFSLYENYIKEKKIKTIFLTAKDDEETVVKGLELADDYMTKPFSTKELITRVKKLLNKTNIIKIGEITLDLDKMEVRRNNDVINLTSLEYKILSLLLTNKNKVITREQLIEKIWEWTGNDVFDNTVTVYLKRIREKLGTNIIKTIKGIGYRIDEE